MTRDPVDATRQGPLSAAGSGVTIVIPHFGDPSIPRPLLQDIRGQVTTRRLQVIVVDDASPTPLSLPDGDVENVTVVRRSQNGGFGAAVNTGVTMASEEVLLVLNSDLRIESTFVEELVTAALPWLPAVVAPRIVSSNGEAAFNARSFPKLRHYVVEWLTPLARFRGTRWWHKAVGHDAASCRLDTALVDWLVGAILLMPTEAYLDVGGFDPRFYMNSEEVDLQRRLRRRGVPSVLIGHLAVAHDSGASTPADRRLLWLTESRRAYTRKWGGHGRQALLELALTCASGVNLIWNFCRRQRGRDVSPIVELERQLEAIWGRSSRDA